MRTGWLLILLFFALCGVARADVVDDNPAAAALGPGNVYVFVRAADGTIVYRHLSNGAWGAWEAVPGLVATSGPAAVEFLGTIQLFARGPEPGAVWQASLQDGRWSTWVPLSGTVTSAPAVARRRGRDAIDLMARGTDNAIWWRTFAPPQWSEWVSVQGNATSAPAFAWYRDDMLDAFVGGGDGVLNGRTWYASSGWNNGSVNGWLRSELPVIGAPAMISRTAGQSDLLVRWNDGTLHYAHWDAGWSTQPQVDPQPLASSPAVVSDHPTRLTVFARVGGELWAKNANDLPTHTWGSWTSLGAVPASGVVTQLPPVVEAPPLVDTDRDGIVDASDRCAGVAGPAGRSGCPTGVLADPSIRYRPVRRGIRVVSYDVKATTGARVVVTCSRGCKRTVVVGRGSKAVRIKALNGRTLKNGTKITITASLAGRLTTKVVDRVSKGRRVEGRATCVPVGC